MSTTNKGKTFTAADLPRGCRWSEDRKAAWCAEMTVRNAVVAMDGDYPVIADELQERIVRRLSPQLISHARNLLQLSAAERAELLAAFDEKGELINCLDPV